jgi:hypothetical protein
MGMEEHTCLHSEPAGKGRKKKKPLVLTLGSPPEKGGKKKTLVLTLGSAIYKGRFCLENSVHSFRALRMHSKLQSPAVIYRGQFCHRKCRTDSIIVTSWTDNAINI